MNKDAAGSDLLLMPDSSEVDAGQPVSIQATWTPPDGTAPAAPVVRILDPAGAEVACAPLVAETDSWAAQIELVSPSAAGVTRYRAEVPGDSGQVLAAADLEVTTHAHSARLNVWDMPDTVDVGAQFSVHVGLACSSGCSLAGRELHITDAAGHLAGMARTGEVAWPRTAALHFAEAAVTAPDEPGLYRFTVTSAADDGTPPHAAGEVEFAVHVVAEGSCDLAIEIQGGDEAGPLAGARVVLHPYRAMTDSEGVARLRVVPGRYRLQLSCEDHLPATEELDVAADLVLQRVLAPAPAMRRPEDDY